MTFVANWRRVLRHAWSVRLMIVAALLSGAEIALPLLEGVLPVPPLTFAALSGLTTAAALIARFIAQDTIGEE